MTTRKEKPLMRLAVAIHEQLQNEQSMTTTIELPTATWQQCKTLVWQMSQAQRRPLKSLADNLKVKVGTLRKVN